MNKKRISLIVFIIGIITLLAGVVFLMVKIVTTPSTTDGEYLVSIGKWEREGTECTQSKCAEDTKCLDENGESVIQCNDSGVIWNFTELGKGTLTTNNHINDYDFRWAIEDGKIIIETDWLYTLNNEFEYRLDQNNKTLTIVKDGEDIKFIPAKSDTN